MSLGDLIPHNSLLGKGLHKMAKAIVMNAMSYMNGVVDQIIKDKVEKDLWLNPQVKLLYEIFTEIIENDEICRADSPHDPVRAFYMNMRDTACAILDEDTHYLMRFFYFWELMNEKYPEFKACFTTARGLQAYEWERTWEGLKKQREALKKGIPQAVPSTVLEQRGLPSGTVFVPNAENNENSGQGTASLSQ